MSEERDLITCIYVIIAILAMLISMTMKILVNEIGRLYFADIIKVITL